jgi:uncharacterized protein YdaT
MENQNQHVIPLGNGWAVKKEGSNRFTVITDTQKDAIKVARELAKHQKADLIVHGKDGKVREMSSYKVTEENLLG